MIWKKRRPSDFNTEIESHLELEVERLKEQGMSEEEAHTAARRTFGNITRAQEYFYESSRWMWWDNLRQDVRYGLCMLAKSPGFTAVALLTLALGIGANTAIFSIVRGVLVSKLPYPSSDQLVAVFTVHPERPSEREPFSPQDLSDLRREQGVLSKIGAYWYSPASSGVVLTGKGPPLYLETAFADSAFFETLRLRPILGRTFVATEDTHGNDAVAVLSNHLWKNRFSANPSIVGKTVLLSGAPVVIVGVMPPSFAFPSPHVDLWMPLARITDKEIPHIRSLRWINVVGRLDSGVSVVQARSGLTSIMQRLAQQYPESNRTLGAATVVGLKESLVGGVTPALLTLFVAVGLVLLLACANLANLLLARGASRSREFAIRSALGASGTRLRMQLFWESVVLALLGGCASIAAASWMTSVLLALSGDSIPRRQEVGMDALVVLFGAALSLVAGAMIGIIPALKLVAIRVWDSLKSDGSGATANPDRQRGRGALVVAQIALACLLLAGSALVLKSLWKLVSTDPGFNPSHVLTVELPLPLYKFSDAHKQAQIYRDELLRRIGAIPGVVAVGGSKTMPLYAGGEPYRYKIVTSAGESVQVMPSAGTFIVTQGYFAALGIPLVSGRVFTEADMTQHRRVAVVNLTMARTYWPGEEAVRKHLHIGGGVLEVIGVVGDVRNEGLDKASGTAVYVPSSLMSRAKLDLFVRTQGAPLSVAAAVRKTIQDFEPDQAISSISPLAQQVRESVGRPKFFTLVLSTFGMVALLLAGLGIFGLISYSVRMRTREFGIRMALGATHRNVLGMVLADAAKLLALGVALGLAGTLAMGRLLRGLLIGVGPADPFALAMAITVLCSVALLASYIPARRATKVDPMVALRYE